jgi:glycosyltransferase involved in cell wall biosynthesis
MCNMEVKPKVSVVMSIYKEPLEWIKISIESILKQTYIDFEFIIINDCPDRYENSELLVTYSNLDSRIRVIENESNIGLTRSLNKGLKFANGKYIARMDADDFSLPDRFEKQYSYMEDNIDCVLLGTCANKINVAGEKIGDLNYPEKHDEIEAGMILKNVMNHPTFFYRKSIIDDHSIVYSEDYLYTEDYYFSCTLLLIGRVHNLQSRLLDYRISSQQIGQSKIEIQDKYANVVRKNNIRNILKLKFNISVIDDVKTDLLWRLNNEYSNNIYIKNIFLCLGFYFKQLSLMDRIRLQFSFNLGFIHRVRLLKFF